MRVTKILFNGKIYEVNGSWKPKEAVAISDEKILRVGSDEEILSMAQEETETINLEGKMVLPGFVDSHAHPSWGGVELLYKVDLFDCKDADEYEERIRAFIEDHPEVNFIQGVGWVNPHFPGEGPSSEDLDKISSQIPMVFTSADHHSVWANSKAMEVALVDEHTICPEGGVIEKIPGTKKPKGTFRENAQDLITRIIPDYSKEEYKKGILKYQEVMATYGITMSHDAMLDGDGPAYEGIIELDKEKKLDFKLSLSFTASAKDPLKDINNYERYRKETDGDMIRGKHIKFFLDGVVEASTAWLKEPYENNPKFSGQPIWQEEDVKEVMIHASAAGLTPHVHVIGDRALQQMLDVLEHVKEKTGKKIERPLAAHVQILDRRDLARIKNLELAISANPYWFTKDPDYYYKLELPFLGKTRAEKMYPMKTFFDQGLLVASASDFSVTPVPKPLRGIHMGITRCFPEMDKDNEDQVLGKEERVSLKEMIESFTINGAKALLREDETGSIEKGKDADLVILEKDLFETPVDEIAFVKVEETISRGKTIYKV